MSVETNLLSNHFIQGIIAKAVADVLHDLFVEVQNSGEIQKNEGWLSPTSVVLSLLVTLLNLALSGGLSGLSVAQIQAALLGLLQTFSGTKIAGTKTVRELAVKCKTRILAS